MLKDGLELKERVSKYQNTLGRDSATIVGNLSDRITELTKFKERINQDMTDIWDDLYEVKNAEDVEDLLERIIIVLQKGISPADQSDFAGLQSNLQELLMDINQFKGATNSRKIFVEVSDKIKEKYEDSKFDFEVLPIIEDIINTILKEIDKKEERWKKENLSLGDKSRVNVHKWKEKTQYLPEYLSEDTVKKVNELTKEADVIISEGKIEDVIFYFEKLNDKEKQECMEKLNAMI